MDVRFYPTAAGNSIPGEPPNMDFAHCLGYYNFNKVSSGSLLLFVCLCVCVFVCLCVCVFVCLRVRPSCSSAPSSNTLPLDMNPRTSEMLVSVPLPHVDWSPMLKLMDVSLLCHKLCCCCVIKEKHNTTLVQWPSDVIHCHTASFSVVHLHRRRSTAIGMRTVTTIQRTEKLKQWLWSGGSEDVWGSGKSFRIHPLK